FGCFRGSVRSRLPSMSRFKPQLDKPKDGFGPCRFVALFSCPGVHTFTQFGRTTDGLATTPTRRQPSSADVNDSPLCCCLSWRLRLLRKLKDRCLLTHRQVCQETKRAIRKFECDVMPLWYVFVDLSKDRRSGAYCSPAKETGRRTYHFRRKGELRSGKNADRRCGILRCGKPTCTGDEVVGRKLVTDRCRARLDVV